MRRKITPAAVLLLWFAATIGLKLMNPASATDAVPESVGWKRARNNSWPGVMNEKVYPFRLDRNARLWWKEDGKRWVPDEDSMWTDIEGSFYKIDHSKLVWSPDGAGTWFDTKEPQWLAVDSNWYRLDQNWVVWMKRGTQQGM